MNAEILRAHCLKKIAVSETLPFDETTLVFKVADKMFCLIDLGNPVSCNLNCDPARAEKLRGLHEEVAPGYHMNKRHWNTISFEGHLADAQILQWIDNSYHLVVAELPKKIRDTLQSRSPPSQEALFFQMQTLSEPRRTPLQFRQSSPS